MKIPEEEEEADYGREAPEHEDIRIAEEEQEEV